MKKYSIYLWRLFGILYFPIYLLSWLLHKIARVILIIAYIGMLNWRISKDIITNLFKWHGRY